MVIGSIIGVKKVRLTTLNGTSMPTLDIINKMERTPSMAILKKKPNESSVLSTVSESRQKYSFTAVRRRKIIKRCSSFEEDQCIT